MPVDSMRDLDPIVTRPSRGADSDARLPASDWTRLYYQRPFEVEPELAD